MKSGIETATIGLIRVSPDPKPERRSIDTANEISLCEGTAAAHQRGTEVAQMVAEILLPTGNRTRLNLLYCAAEQGPKTDARRIKTAAFAVELLHVASLVHDDVIDRAELRRAAPTAASIWGARRAALVGGAVIMRAVRQIGHCGPGAVNAFTGAANDMCVGGMRELEIVRSPDRGIGDYLATARLKTASPLGTAGWLGAELSGAGDAERDAIMRFGLDLGVAWQIWDDAIDLAASPEQTGKSASDLAGGLVTLPVILALEADDHLRREFAEACAAGDDLQVFRDDILATGALDASINLAERFAQRALLALGGLPHPQGLHALLDETRERHAEMLGLTASIAPAEAGLDAWPPDPTDDSRLRNMAFATRAPEFAELHDLVARIETSASELGKANDAWALAAATEVAELAAAMMGQLPDGPATKVDARTLLVADRALTFALRLVAAADESVILEFAERAESAFERQAQSDSSA